MTGKLYLISMWTKIGLHHLAFTFQQLIISIVFFCLLELGNRSLNTFIYKWRATNLILVKMYCMTASPVCDHTSRMSYVSWHRLPRNPCDLVTQLRESIWLTANFVWYCIVCLRLCIKHPESYTQMKVTLAHAKTLFLLVISCNFCKPASWRQECHQRTIIALNILIQK